MKPLYALVALVLAAGCSSAVSEPVVAAMDPDAGIEGPGPSMDDPDAAMEPVVDPAEEPAEPDLFPKGASSGTVTAVGEPLFTVRDVIFRHVDAPDGKGYSVVMVTDSDSACEAYDRGAKTWNKVNRVEIVFYRDGRANPTQGGAFWRAWGEDDPSTTLFADVTLVQNRVRTPVVDGDIVTPSFTAKLVNGGGNLRLGGDGGLIRLDFSTGKMCEVLN